MSTDQTLRSQIPAAEHYAYLDNAAKGPLTIAAAQALRDYADDVEQHGGVHWVRWFSQIAQLKQRLGHLIGTTPSSLALVRNTAEAIGTVAEGFDWREGDNVVVPAAEFPSNLFPWQNLESRGVECRTAVGQQGTVDLAAIDSACDSRTRLIACSWVGWATGYRVDLDSLCDIAHRHRCRLLVDGIQAVGVQPLDLIQTPIDFLAGEGRKWLLGPEGLGYLYVRPDALNELRPTRVGWASMKQENVFGDHFELRDDASRFESGVESFPLVAALNASLSVLEAETPAQRAAQIEAVREHASERLRSIGGEVLSQPSPHHSTILTARFAGHDIEAIRKHCWSHKVIVSPRGGGIRLSPHAYNTIEDIDRAVDVLGDFLSR